jgi:hypothetical protein
VGACRVTRHARPFPAVALCTALLAAGITTACSSSPRSNPAVTVAVSAGHSIRVVVPHVATITGLIGSVRGTGSLTATVVRSALPFGDALRSAGEGVDVQFSGVRLIKPLTITFAGARTRPVGMVPVVAHHLPDGAWSLARATVDASGQMTVRTETFSPHFPAWLDPVKWVHWLGDRLASLIGGRTPPIACPGGKPSWATVVKHTDEAHTCLVSNTDQSTHTVRAEVQIKSNRGTALEVDPPPGADYTWAQGQPWGIRSFIWAHLIHQDPNLMLLLPAGATMTAGFRQPFTSEDLAFHVRVTGWSLTYTLIGDIVDTLTGFAANSAGELTAVLYLATKCSSAVNYASLSASNPLSTATFASALKCVITEASDELSSPAKALGAARSLLGPDVDQADLTTATQELTSVGGKLLTFGWVVSLWPYFQAGWGQIPDVIHNLLTGGASTLIDLDMRGVLGPPPPASSVAALTPTGTTYSTSGIVAWRDGYWFAAATRASSVANPSTVMVTIYRWEGHSWQRQAMVNVSNSNGTLASGGLDPSTPITLGSLSGTTSPDFLIHSWGADTNWLNVVSDATGNWAAVPFADSGGQTVGEGIDKIRGTVVTVGYNSCVPSCAGGHITDVGFRYHDGAFEPVDPPGSCTGEALAQAAHTTFGRESHGQYAISGFACTSGYAAASATNELYGWQISFQSTGNGWKVLGSGNLMPNTGMPSSVYRTLSHELAGTAQTQYYPY